MKKKRVYKVCTRYIFSGVFEVTAESQDEARRKVIEDCGLVMGSNIRSTLPDEEIDWEFGMHSEIRTGRITIVR